MLNREVGRETTSHATSQTYRCMPSALLRKGLENTGQEKMKDIEFNPVFLLCFHTIQMISLMT